MTEVNKAPLLVVAGVRDEKSLGWAAASRWLEDDPDNRLLLTVRSRKSQKFAEARQAEADGRIEVVTVDYTDPLTEEGARASSVATIKHKLESLVGEERAVRGIVHSIANAPPENFTTPAHELRPETYLAAYEASALSLLKVIQGCRNYLRERAGIVTFGYEEPGHVTEDYGGALSVAKASLSQLVKVMGVSLGQSEPSARTLEITPGFVDTYAGLGVAMGISQQNGVRVKPSEMAVQLEEYFRESASLPYTSSEAQRAASGQLAVDFVKGGPVYDQMTGETIRVNAGRSIRNSSIVPKAPSA